MDQEVLLSIHIKYNAAIRKNKNMQICNNINVSRLYDAEWNQSEENEKI